MQFLTIVTLLFTPLLSSALPLEARQTVPTLGDASSTVGSLGTTVDGALDHTSSLANSLVGTVGGVVDDTLTDTEAGVPSTSGATGLVGGLTGTVGGLTGGL